MALQRIERDAIVDSAINAAKIADGTIVAAEIANDTITTAKLVDDAVTAVKIHDDVELGGPSLGTSSVIRTNANTISENITIPSGTNAMSAGPMTLGNYTITINGVYTII